MAQGLTISHIQLKRCLNYKGTFKDAKNALKYLDPPLEIGEPIIVGCYLDPSKYTKNPSDSNQGPDRFFLGIGRYLGQIASPIIVPLFDENNGQIDEHGNLTIPDIEDKYEEAINKFFISEVGQTLLKKYTSNDASSIINVVSNNNEISEDVKQKFYEQTGKTLDDATITQQELNEFILNNFLHSGGLVYWDN